MNTVLAVAVPVALLTLVGLAFTAAICLATGALVGVAYVVLGSWSAPGPVPDE